MALKKKCLLDNVQICLIIIVVLFSNSGCNTNNNEKFTNFAFDYPNAIRDLLQVDDVQFYTITGIEYEVWIKEIDIDKQTVSININGEDSRAIKEDELHTLLDGTALAVEEVRLEDGTPVVEFYMGKK